jgi:hypothetical protein
MPNESPASHVTSRGRRPTRNHDQSRPAAAVAIPATARPSASTDGRSGVCTYSAASPVATRATRCTAPSRPRDHSHTASPIPKTCQRYTTRPSNAVRRRPGDAVAGITATGATTTPHATAGSVQRRRQKSRPSRAAATAASVNIVSCAGSVQYEWSM